MTSDGGQGASREVPVHTGDDQRSWQVPEEVPIAFVYNDLTFAVMLATPADLQDYAIGFSLTEGIARSIDDIEDLQVRHRDQGIELHIKLAANAFRRLELRQERRNLTGRSSCGVCGLDNMEALFEPLPPVGDIPAVLEGPAVARAVEVFADSQPMKSLNHSVHGAAWVNLVGQLQLVREDVGRHNALDKLAGAMVQAGADIAAGFCLMSSRCSYELVEKAARMGMPALVTLSAPTALAIDRAAEAKLSLATWSRDGLARF